MPKIDEFQLQRAFVIWFGGFKNIHPARLPEVIFWHTPNGGARTGLEGKRFGELGVLAGIHDLLFLHRGRLFGLEWKAPGGKLSPAQVALHPLLLAAGMARSAVVDTLDTGKQKVREWGLTRFGY